MPKGEFQATVLYCVVPVDVTLSRTSEKDWSFFGEDEDGWGFWEGALNVKMPQR